VSSHNRQRLMDSNRITLENQVSVSSHN